MDNLELMQQMPDNYVNLIYCDILYGTGRNFKDFQDLSYDQDTITKFYTPRIKETHRILKGTGTLALHMDYRISHWLRAICDKCFGYKNCINIIQWQYASGGSSKRRLSQKNDEIIIYAKDRKLQKFNPQKEKSYNRGFKPYRFKGVEEFEDDIGWYTMVNMKCIWDIPMVGRTSGERVDYATQKPLKLMDRIRDLYTDEGDVIADVFCGSGSMLVSAKTGKRKYIGCDISEKAVEISKNRLNKIQLQDNGVMK
jgi:site-specific DNA-methyltransferase (adenine-specific)